MCFPTRRSEALTTASALFREQLVAAIHMVAATLISMTSSAAALAAWAIFSARSSAEWVVLPRFVEKVATWAWVFA